MANETATKNPLFVDFKRVFDRMSGMCLVLDTNFVILAQNKAHAEATLSSGREAVGRGLFEVFPDNPGDYNANGVSAVRQSLLKVLKTRETDVMPIVRYDVQAAMGPFQARYWAITNTPVLGPDGYVRWIINRAEDVTELVELRMAAKSKN
jgi:PAS domain-containing protein